MEGKELVPSQTLGKNNGSCIFANPMEDGHLVVPPTAEHKERSLNLLPTEGQRSIQHGSGNARTFIPVLNLPYEEEPIMQVSYYVHFAQSTIPETQVMQKKSTVQSGVQQEALNTVQQSVQLLLQQPLQSVVKLQEHPQSSIHRQHISLLQTDEANLQSNVHIQKQIMGLRVQANDLSAKQNLLNHQRSMTVNQTQKLASSQTNNLSISTAAAAVRNMP